MRAVPSAGPRLRPDPPPQQKGWFPASCLAFAVALAYANSLHAPFLFDDAGAVLNNVTIRHLWSLDALHPPHDGSTTTGRPAVNLSYALNYAVSGDQVWSYHALNLAIHVLAALTLFGLLRRTFQSPRLRPRFGPGATPLAFVAAGLWALHPLQTETVVCIAQRTESLCSLCYLLTLYAFSRAADCHSLDDKSASAHRRPWSVISVAMCFVGMGAKEVMATAPLVVLLYDRTFVAGTFSAAWQRRRGYYAALAASWLVLGWLVTQSGGGRGVAAGFGLGVSSWSYLLKQCEALVLYLRLAAFPYPLVLDYGNDVTRSVGEVWWQGLIVLGLLAGTLWALRRHPVLGFAGAWFFVILAPSSSFVPLVTQTMAEHRMYLPLAAVVTLAVAGLFRLVGPRAWWPLGTVALVLGGATVARNHDYRDPLSIWTDNVTHYPQSARGQHNLALVLQERGHPDEADTHFARAVSLQPAYVSGHYSWGVALRAQGRLAEALAQFETAAALAPGHVDARVNLANTLVQLQRPADAIPHYEAALQLQPGADVHYDLGIALLGVDRPDEAATQFLAALQFDPALPDPHYQLARLADRAGQTAAADQQYRETLRLAPQHAEAHAHLGLLLARAERIPEAEQQLRAAVQLNPGDADALANLGNVLLIEGQPREALAFFDQAARLRPNDPRLQASIQAARAAVR